MIIKSKEVSLGFGELDCKSQIGIISRITSKTVHPKYHSVVFTLQCKVPVNSSNEIINLEDDWELAT